MTVARSRPARIVAMAAGLLLGTLAILPAPARAQATPLQPLRLVESLAGQWGFDVAVGIFPFGRDVPVLDGRGEITTETRLEYGTAFSGEVSYNLTDVLAVSLAAVADGAARRTVAADGAAAGWRWEGGVVGPALGVRWQAGPVGGVSRAFRLDAALGEAGSVAVSWSVDVVRDPVVLSGALSAEAAPGQDTTGVGLSASVGVGFVANDKVSLSASVRHRFSSAIDRLPQSDLTAGVYYSPAADARWRWGLETTVHLRGPEVRIGFGVALSASGPGR